ncbi:hypothetical protein Tco_0181508, partial [Tanacetum coccineum]
SPMFSELLNGNSLVVSKSSAVHAADNPDNRQQHNTTRVLIDFLTLVQRGLHAQVTTVRTDKGMEFLNKTLHAFFAKRR